MLPTSISRLGIPFTDLGYLFPTCEKFMQKCQKIFRTFLRL